MDLAGGGGKGDSDDDADHYGDGDDSANHKYPNTKTIYNEKVP